eukprot:COSAG01_NODE_2834_length_6995_cov_5.819751_2_plen_159_part_00
MNDEQDPSELAVCDTRAREVTSWFGSHWRPRHDDGTSNTNGTILCALHHPVTSHRCAPTCKGPPRYLAATYAGTCTQRPLTGLTSASSASGTSGEAGATAPSRTAARPRAPLLGWLCLLFAFLAALALFLGELSLLPPALATLLASKRSRWPCLLSVG